MAICSVQFSRSVMSDFLRPNGLQHSRLPCPSPTPGAYSDSCPSSQWCLLGMQWKQGRHFSQRSACADDFSFENFGIVQKGPTSNQAWRMKGILVVETSSRLKTDMRTSQKGQETSLVVQWLRLCATTTGGTGPIPDWETKILQATQSSITEKRKKGQKDMGSLEREVWINRSRKANNLLLHAKWEIG